MPRSKYHSPIKGTKLPREMLESRAWAEITEIEPGASQHQKVGNC